MIGKLRGRSAAELRDRAVQQARAVAEMAGLLERPALSASMESWPRTPWAPVDDAMLASIGPEDRAAIVDRADRIVAGTFDVLGLTALSYGQPVDWQLDPLSGRSAPAVHWRRVPYLDESRVGDHKVTWEVNRHQWLIHLGQAWLLTSDPHYGSTAARLVTDWIDQNPPKRGINWCSSLEMAFRVQSWIHGLRLFRMCSAFMPMLRRAMVSSAWLQLRHIECNLSTWFSPNTHLTGEALALLCGGTAWPDLPRSTEWRRLGWAILEHELERQVRDDGVYFEQTAWYQAYTLDFYEQALDWATVAGIQVPERAIERIHAAARALRLVTRPDGTIVPLGDDDGGHALPYPVSDGGDLTLSLWRAALRFSDGTLVPPLGRGHSALAWTGGASAVSAARLLPRDTGGRDSRALRAGGWVLLAERGASPSEDHWCVLDAGPHGGLSSPHSHADALAFDLTVRGCPIFVDPGTCRYVGPERARYRSTAVHNTISVGGADSSEQKGPFSWASTAQTRLLAFGSSSAGSWVSASHDGYMRLAARVVHQRVMLRRAGRYWIVMDTLESAGASGFEQTFQLAHAVVPKWEGGAYRLRSGGVEAMLALDPRLAKRLEARCVSPLYGVEQPADAVVARGEVSGHASFCTAISDARECLIEGIAWKEAGRCWELRHDGGTDVVARPSGTPVTLGEVTFDGELLILATHHGRRTIVAAGAGVLEVSGARHRVADEAICALWQDSNETWTLEG